MMCPGVLQVNACHQQGEQQGLIRWTGEYRDCAIAKLVPKEAASVKRCVGCRAGVMVSGTNCGISTEYLVGREGM